MATVELALEGSSDHFREFASVFPVWEIERAHDVAEAEIAAGNMRDSQHAKEFVMIGQLLIRPAFEKAFGVNISLR